jgi:RimJ/RimL family protein N-acetyltransferase
LVLVVDLEEGTMIQDRLVSQPTIETDRLVLRPLRRSDAGLLTMYASDPRVSHNTRSIPHPLPPGAVEAFIGRSMADTRDEDVWAIDAQSELRGIVALKRLDRDQSEITYWVAPAFWNTGIASDAVKSLVAANPRRDKVCYGVVFQDNPASARVLTNAGFDYLGDAEAFSVARNGMVATWTYIRKL